MRFLPPGQTLKNALSDEQFARFTKLKTEIGNNGAIDDMRPWLAAATLRDRVLQSWGLTNTAVSSTVLRLARGASVSHVNTTPDYQIFERNSKGARSVACLELDSRGPRFARSEHILLTGADPRTLGTRRLGGSPACPRLCRGRASVEREAGPDRFEGSHASTADPS
jgi:hypothetical protein